VSLRKRLRHTGLAKSLPRSSFKLERASVPLTGRSRRMLVLGLLPVMISLSTIRSWTIFNYSMFVSVIILYHAIPTLKFSRPYPTGIENITFLLLTSSSPWVEAFRGLLLIRLLLLMSPRWLVSILSRIVSSLPECSRAHYFHPWSPQLEEDPDIGLAYPHLAEF